MSVIEIDDRAGSRDLVKHPPLDEFGRLCRLGSGDVCFTGNGPEGVVLIGIEVKSIFDLVSSIATGRLQGTQFPGMFVDYDRVYLLYYGAYRPSPKNWIIQVPRGQTARWTNCKLGKKREIPWSYVEKFLMTAASRGVEMKHVLDVREAAVWIHYLQGWWDKPWDEHKSFEGVVDRSAYASLPRVGGKRMSDQMISMVRIAMALPGLGKERAIAAADHFESIGAMVNASEAQWLDVDGVGKVIAQSVCRAVQGW